MDLIREPLDVDFVVDPRPLTEAKKLLISEFIAAAKAKRSAMIKAARKTKRKKQVV